MIIINKYGQGEEFKRPANNMKERIKNSLSASSGETMSIPGRLTNERIERINKAFGLTNSDSEFFIIKNGTNEAHIAKRDCVYVELDDRKMGKLNIETVLELKIKYAGMDIKEAMSKEGKNFDRIVLRPEPKGKPPVKSWRFEDHFEDWGKPRNKQ